MLSMIIKFFKILNSEDSPLQIAIAIWFALFISFLPLANPLSLVLLFVVCIVRINLTAFLLFWGLFVLVSPLYLGIVDQLGHFVLTHQALLDTWTALYNSPAGMYTRFNQTIITGGVVFAFAALLPMLLLLPSLIKKYREQLMPFVEKTKLVQSLKASKFYQMYSDLS